MTNLIERIYEKIVLAVALVAAVASAVWFWHQQAVIRSLHREPTRPVLSGPAYAASQWPLPQAPGVLWSKPPAQTRGSEWLYEVFTPPAITYNRGTQTFAISSSQPLAQPLVAVPGLQLLEAKLQPYRLQLVGYVGESGDPQAMFLSQRSPETLLARPGHHFESLGLTLKSIEVRKVTVEGGDFGPVYEFAAMAVLQDEFIGAEVVLDSRKRKITDTPLAIINRPGVKDGARELREGDTFADDDDTYRVERIQLEPAEVVVTRTPSGRHESETLILLPVGHVARKQIPGKPFSTNSSTAVAAANP